MNTVTYRRRTLERYDGHKALWLRVIIRAAFDLASYKNDPRVGLRKHADTASKWLFDKSYLINSFETVCSMLNLPPDKVRNWAVSLTKAEVQKMEHLERGSTVKDDFDLDMVELRKTNSLDEGSLEEY